MMRLRTKRPLASVQAHFVRAREVMGDVLCVWSPFSPTRRAYRAVLEVSALNFLLKAPEEQDALVERFSGLLKALTFPIQILVRNQRLDLQPYLAHLRAQVPESEANGAVWSELAASLEALLQQIGSRRTLIERHCYLIIPAPEVARTATPGRLRPGRRHAQQEELVARAWQELAIRLEMIQAQLAALGLRSHRLQGEDLARFYQECLSSERALQHPLRRDHLASVGHLPAVHWQTTRRLASDLADQQKGVS